MVLTVIHLNELTRKILSIHPENGLKQMREKRRIEIDFKCREG
jgi:hypothetical protein